MGTKHNMEHIEHSVILERNIDCVLNHKSLDLCRPISSLATLLQTNISCTANGFLTALFEIIFAGKACNPKELSAFYTYTIRPSLPLQKGSKLGPNKKVCREAGWSSDKMTPDGRVEG